MSRTSERYTYKKARRAGYLAGLYGEPKTANPYRGIDSKAYWWQGWEEGQKDSKERKT